jgi:hypothetical protein
MLHDLWVAPETVTKEQAINLIAFMCVRVRVCGD